MKHIIWACAVCVGAFDKNRVAFLATTMFMTALPLSLLGGLAVWLKRRSNRS